MNINNSYINNNYSTNTLTYILTCTHTHTYAFTFTYTYTYTYTYCTLTEMQSGKGIARKSCQKSHADILNFEVDVIQLMSPSTLPGRFCLPGRNPLLLEYPMLKAGLNKQRIN